MHKPQSVQHDVKQTHEALLSADDTLPPCNAAAIPGSAVTFQNNLAQIFAAAGGSATASAVLVSLYCVSNSMGAHCMIMGAQPSARDGSRVCRLVCLCNAHTPLWPLKPWSKQPDAFHFPSPALHLLALLATFMAIAPVWLSRAALTSRDDAT